MDSGENIILTDLGMCADFCATLRGLNLLYVEFSKIKTEGVWSIYAVEGGRLKIYRVFFSGRVSLRFEILFDLVEERKNMFRVNTAGQSVVFLTSDFFLEPSLEQKEFRCRVYGDTFRIRPLGPGVFEQIVYDVFYRQFFFADESKMLEYIGEAIYLGNPLKVMPEDWEVAIMTEKAKSGLALNGEYEAMDERVIGLYRAREVVLKIGAEKLREAFSKDLPIRKEFYGFKANLKLGKAQSEAATKRYACQKLLATINATIGEDLANKYADFRVLEVDGKKSLAELFAVPRVWNFSKEADAQILEAILSGEIGPELTEYYLRNYLFLPEKAIASLFKVAIMIVKKTKKVSLFKVAREILDKILALMPETIREKEMFKTVIVKAYLLRAEEYGVLDYSRGILGALSHDLYGRAVDISRSQDGSLTDSPKVHEVTVSGVSRGQSYEGARTNYAIKSILEIYENLKSDDERGIFRETVKWLLGVETERARRIDTRFNVLVEKLKEGSDSEILELPEWIRGEVLDLKYRDGFASEWIIKITELLSPEEAAEILSGCKSGAEVAAVMGDLLGEDIEGGRIILKEICLEKLLEKENDLQIRKYCLNKLIERYDDFIERFFGERSFLLMAAAEGVSYEEELGLIGQLAAKFSETERGSGDRARIKRAMEIARERTEEVKLQREAVLKKDFLGQLRGE
ncbi:MAG: hypothetical protein Q4A79_02880 [Candidatus Saccharibacteria bacterium]|nr:hypothetical protein [Candidatus Saccharibacteria bacterium]